MAWWKLFWNPVEEVAPNVEEVFEQSAFENVISEPVRSIVKAMITDRKRFIIQIEFQGIPSTVQYAVLDIDTEEEFFVSGVYAIVTNRTCERQYHGPEWARSYEIKWAIETVSNHYSAVQDRAARIRTARERNRLIEIYA